MIANARTHVATVTELLNLCQKRENVSMGLGVVLKSDDTSVEQVSCIWCSDDLSLDFCDLGNRASGSLVDRLL